VSIFESPLRALNEAGVRYVVVGGLATVLHGYARLTADVDLVVDLEPNAARAVIDVLTGLGLVPVVPEPPERFADPEARARWIGDKGMRVFSLYDPTNPLRRVDLFVEHPIDFEDLFERADVVQLTEIDVRIASIPDLIHLKRLADRPRDREDIEQLERILEAKQK